MELTHNDDGFVKLKEYASWDTIPSQPTKLTYLHYREIDKGPRILISKFHDLKLIFNR